jgi:hypothetical protein
VLVTPHQKYNSGFEFLIGSWSDEALIGFSVKEFGNYKDAECEALNYPDINWDQLVEFHYDYYKYANEEIKKIIDKTNMAVGFKAKLMTPQEVKDKMFDRVIAGQILLKEEKTFNGFRTVLDMNDIISFKITNPWTKNLQEMISHLLKNNRLKIFKIINKNGVQCLVGRTDIGTTYEILLVPTIIDNFIEWKKLNFKLSKEHQLSALKNCLKIQKFIDSMFILR